MKHLFVPCEIAIIAKNKGFDEDFLGYYTKREDLRICHHYYSSDWEPFPLEYIKAPLYQQLVDWFREKHGIEIYYLVNFYNKSEKLGYTYCIDKFINDIHTGENFDDDQMELLGDKKGFNTHLEALEKAFEEAFKLI